MTNKRPATNSNHPGIAAITFLVWLATVAIGLFTLYALRSLAVDLLLMGGIDRKAIEVASLWVLCLLAPAYLAFVIVTGEYHRKILGQPRAWKLFAATFVIEATIVALYLI